MQGRLTHAHFQAINAANADRVSPGFFLAVSASREEAEDKAFYWNAAKAFARAVAGKMR